MSNVYSEMKNKFDSWSNDASGFIMDKVKLASASEIHINEVWTALIETCEEDIDTMNIELLQPLFGTFSITTQRMLIDHLPKGKYHSQANKVKKQVPYSVKL